MARTDIQMGETYGRLIVVGSVCRVQGGHKRYYRRCLCSCGSEKIIRTDALKSGAAKSCGCIQKEIAAELGRRTALSLESHVFGRLKVLSRNGTKWRKSLWLCQCECGEKVTVSSRALISGGTK